MYGDDVDGVDVLEDVEGVVVLDDVDGEIVEDIVPEIKSISIRPPHAKRKFTLFIYFVVLVICTMPLKKTEINN